MNLRLWALIVYVMLLISVHAADAKQVTVALQEQFVLIKGDTAYIQDINAELHLKGFTNSPCPEGAMCGWSGLAVHYEFKINGNTYTDASAYGGPYDIDMINTDFETYATFSVHDPVKRCMETKDKVDSYGVKIYFQNGCWSTLAKKRSDVNYCRRIPTGKMRDACIEYLLVQIDQPELCAEIERPLMFCKYKQAVSKLDPDMCSDILTYDHQKQCYKEISEQTGKGIAMCAHLKTKRKSDIDLCKKGIEDKGSSKNTRYPAQ